MIVMDRHVVDYDSYDDVDSYYNSYDDGDCNDDVD